MVIARVSAADGVGTTSATFGATPRVGNLLLCSVNSFGTPTISGWTEIVSATSSSLIATLFAKMSAGSEGTITPSATIVFGVNVCEYSGAKNGYEQAGTAVGTATASNVTSFASGAITTTDAASLVFLVGHPPTTATGLSWSGGPTVILNNVAAGGLLNGEYLPGTTVSSFASTLSWTNAGNCRVLIAAFRAAVVTLNNYQSVKVGNGMSTGERIR